MSYLPTLKIENFKSIQSVEIACRRVNLFVGKTNNGKSSLVESLSLLGDCRPEPGRRFLSKLVDAPSLEAMFHHGDQARPIVVEAGPLRASLRASGQGNDAFLFENTDGQDRSFQAEVFGNGQVNHMAGQSPDFVRRYQFSGQTVFESKAKGGLAVPLGENLAAVALAHKGLLERLDELALQAGIGLSLEGGKFAAKALDGHFEDEMEAAIAVANFKRIAFWLAAIESNPGACLVFDEPEFHLEPHYVDYLCDIILQNTDKQFFLSSHNPIFIEDIINNVPASELEVFSVELEDFRTVVKPLSQEQIGQLLDEGSDIFAHLI